MKKILCNYPDCDDREAISNKHLEEKHNYKCECYVCRNMQVGKYCKRCGWCKGNPEPLNKNDWERFRVNI